MFSEGSLDGVVDTLEQRSARILDPGNSRRESASFFLARPREMSCSVQSGEAGGVEGEPQVDQGV